MTITITYTHENLWLYGFFGQNRLDWTQLNLNRQIREGLPSYSKGFNIPNHHNPTGFRWKSDDGATKKWYPQGLSGTARATNPSNSRFLVSSWYGNEKANYRQKGARLSFINYDSSSSDYCKYRHVLLVQNKQNIDESKLFGLSDHERSLYAQLELFAPVPIHAGGVAWYKGFIYVVDTWLGIRVFDPTLIYPAQADALDKTKCGKNSNGYYAFNYRYILPEIGYYKISGASPHSFISVGDIDGAPCLWVGRYRKLKSSNKPRLFGFDLNQDGTINVAVPVKEFEPQDKNGPAYHMQGVYRSKGNTWMSVTGKKPAYKNSTARLITQKNGADKGERWRWPYGAEDLYLEADRGVLWCQTEYPPGSTNLGSDRCVFGVDFNSYAPDLH
jgi:hypothetical protein